MVYNGCMHIIRPFDNEIVVVEDFLSQAEADFVLELATGDPKLWDGSNDGSGLKEWYGNQLRVDPQNLNDRYQEYKDFYKFISYDANDPLTWMHNKVEGKQEYTSLLFIPEKSPYDLWNRDTPRGIKLFIQRVFILWRHGLCVLCGIPSGVYVFYQHCTGRHQRDARYSQLFRLCAEAVFCLRTQL